MWPYVPLVIIVIAVAVIVVIAVRKFPQLANLDVHQLPQEKTHRRKKDLLTKRFEARARASREIWHYRLRPLLKGWAWVQFKFRVYVGTIERLWHHEQMQKRKGAGSVNPQERQEQMARLIKDGEDQLAAGALDKAEDIFIQAVTLDQKSAPAYKGLGATYLAKGAITEARETYRFLLRLAPADDAVMVKLAGVEEDSGNTEEAIMWYQQAVIANDTFSPYFYHLAELLLKVKQPLTAREAIVQAVELESKNPKYLDLLIEIAILCRDTKLALDGWNELRLVNPDNQKLESLKARINEL